MIINMPLVTVLLPCYNGELYIEEAVRSMMNQTYSNLEILIIDDFSSDNSNAILTRLAAEDNRIRLVRNEKNLKLIKTLNKGLDLANGIYIARMDADDISLPERIEKQMNFMLSNPEVDLCGTNYIMIDGEGIEMGASDYPLTNSEMKLNILFSSPLAHPTVIFKRDFIRDIGKYREDFLNAEDYELWIRVAINGVMANIEDKLLLYRWHGNNISLTGGIEQNIKSVSLAFTMNPNILEKIPFDYINLHAKFVAVGGWKHGTVEELKKLNKWGEILLDLHKEKFKELKYLINIKTVSAMFCLIKNYKLNSYRVCLMALSYLFLNPIVAVKYLVKKY